MFAFLDKIDLYDYHDGTGGFGCYVCVSINVVCIARIECVRLELCVLVFVEGCLGPWYFGICVRCVIMTDSCWYQLLNVKNVCVIYKCRKIREGAVIILVSKNIM